MSRSIAAAPGRRRGVASGSTSRRSRSALGVPRALGGIADGARTGVRALWGRRWPRIALLAAAIALPLLGGGWLLLRNSSFVAVQRVRISGVHGPEAAAIDAALTAAARRESTLNVSAGALRSAVAEFPVVREVRAVPHFPHAMTISVVEQLPVAALLAGGTRTAVAADGVVLGPSLLRSNLPVVSGSYGPAVGSAVRSPELLAVLSVLGAAPGPLERLVEHVFEGPKGLTVAMRNGLLVYFGNATRLHAKWLSLARVLADSGSNGASYVDVRLPGRPAAGFPAGVTPPDAGTAIATGSSEPGSSTESTVASLAAGLTSGASVSAAGEPAAGSSTETQAEADGEASESPGPSAEGAATETSAGSEAEAPQTATPTG
jgi:cell division protein FtsQ